MNPNPTDKTTSQTILRSRNTVKIQVNTNAVLSAPLEGLDEVSSAQRLKAV